MSEEIKELSTVITIEDRASETFDQIAKSVMVAFNAYEQFEKRVKSPLEMPSMNEKMSENAVEGTLSALRNAVSETSVKASIPNVLKEAASEAPKVSNAIGDATTRQGIFGKVAKNSAEIATSSFKKLANAIHKIKEKAGNAFFSLKNIGEAYRGVQGLLAGASAFGGLLEAADERSRMNARIANLSAEQRGASIIGGNGYDVQTIDKAMFEKANELGMDKGRFAEQTMGMLTGTGGAFSGIGEALEFSELLTKQFVASGVGAEQAAGAIEQLKQGLSKGALQGEDLKSILSSAPQIVDLFAEKLGVASSQVRQLASQGKLTADVIKGAILDNEEKIDRAFEAMPVTWEAVANRMKNDIAQASSLLSEKLSAFAQSDAFSKLTQALVKFASVFIGMLDHVTHAFSPVVSAVSWMLDAMSQSVDILSAVAIGIGAVIAAQQVMVATNPYLLLATAIIGAVVALRKLWNDNLDFQYGIKKGWESVIYTMAVGISYLKQGFLAFVGTVVTGIGGILYSVQGMVNTAVKAYNFLSGSNAEAFTFGEDTIKTGLEMLDPQKGTDERDAFQRVFRDKLAELDDEKISLEKAAANESNEKTELAYGQSPGKPLFTKGTTKLDKESLDILKDLTSREVIHRYTTISPKIEARFGDIHQSADADEMLNKLSREITEQAQASLLPAYEALT